MGKSHMDWVKMNALLFALLEELHTLHYTQSQPYIEVSKYVPSMVQKHSKNKVLSLAITHMAEKALARESGGFLCLQSALDFGSVPYQIFAEFAHLLNESIGQDDLVIRPQI